MLPFQNLSRHPDFDEFANGLAEDILGALARFRLISVIARNSSSIYQGRDSPIRDIARELGVTYVLEGSVRKAGNRIRVATQLIETSTETHLWAETYDQDFTDPFILQDTLTHAIVSSIEPVLVDHENKSGRPARLDADREGMNLLKAAGWHLYRFRKEDNARAIELLDQAIVENPNAYRRYQALSVGHMWDLTFGWTHDPVDSTRRAVATSEKSLELNDADAWNHAVFGWALVYAGEFERGMAELERTVELHPNSMVSCGVSAWVLGHSCEAEQAIAAMERSISLTPQGPFVFQFLIGGALSHFWLGHYEEAAALGAKAVLRRSNSPGAHIVMAASYAQADSPAKATEVLEKLGRHLPQVSIEWVRQFVPIRETENRDALLEGLRRAGMPEA